MVTVETCIFVKLLVFLWHLFQSFLVLDPRWTVIELCGGGREGRRREGGREGRGRGRGSGRDEEEERREEGGGEGEGEKGGEGGGRREEKECTDEQLAVTYKG